MLPHPTLPQALGTVGLPRRLWDPRMQGASPGDQLRDLMPGPQYKLHPDSELCPGLSSDHKMIGTGQSLPPYS